MAYRLIPAAVRVYTITPKPNAHPVLIDQFAPESAVGRRRVIGSESTNSPHLALAIDNHRPMAKRMRHSLVQQLPIKLVNVHL